MEQSAQRNTQPPEEEARERWESLSRRQARAFAIAGLVVPIVAILLGFIWTGGANVLITIALLGVVCGLMALPLGLMARPRQRFPVAVGTLELVFVLVTLVRMYDGGSGHNETLVVARLRTINIAQGTYLASAGRYGTLEELAATELMDSGYPPDQFRGYKYAITAGVSRYTLTAEPASSNSGRFNYFTREDAVVRWGTKAPSKDQIGQPVQ